MNVLALDTSLGACSAAVLRAHEAARRLNFAEERMARGHAEALLPMVEQIMREAGLSFADLDLIAATLGPGTFTGIRVAIAAARGFALATSAKLWGTDTLTVMAAGARAEIAVAAERSFAVAVDARRERIYLGCFGRDGERLLGPELLPLAAAVERLPDHVKIAGGSGATALAEAAATQGRAIEAALPDLQPSASVLAELAAESGETLPTLRPLYLRPPDAKPQGHAAIARRT